MTIAPTLPNLLILSPDGDRRAMAIYGAAHFGKSLFWYASETLCAFYLTEAAGLSGAAMGSVIAIGLVVAAVLDPLVDIAFARTLSTAHGAARMQVVGACLSAVTMTALFLCGSLPGRYRLAAILATIVGFRMAYALYDQPQNALINLATRSRTDRTSVAGLRLVLSGVAAIVVVAIATGLARQDAAPAGADLRFGIVGAAMSLGAIGSAWLLFAIRGDRPVPVDTGRTRRRRLAPLPERCWVPLTLAIASAITIPLFAKAQPYLARHTQDPVFWATLIGSGVPIGSMLSQPVWTMMAHHRSRAEVVRHASLLLVAAGTGFYLVASRSPLLSAACAILIGVGNGGLGIMIWAAFGDAVARPAGQPGWNFGLLTAGMKLGLAVGALVLGQLLDAIPGGVAPAAWISLVMALGPVAGGCLCVWLTKGFHTANDGCSGTGDGSRDRMIAATPRFPPARSRHS